MKRFARSLTDRKSGTLRPIPGVLSVLVILGVMTVGVPHVPRPAAAERSAVRPIPSQGRMAPRISGRAGTSTNWSGYALIDQNGHDVREVQGSWTVPSVANNCPNSYSAMWVGIDGDGSNTVEQIGTDQDFVNGQPRYYAWYEMYPKGLVVLSQSTFPVTAGDTVSADVKSLAGGSFSLTLTNLTHPNVKPFQTTQRLNQAKRLSAEWVAEAPWSGGVLPLANFGAVTFTGCQANIGGQPRSLGEWMTFPNLVTTDTIFMASSGGTIKASPGPVSGDQFSITWSNFNCQ